MTASEDRRGGAMSDVKCPGQERRFWRPKDVVEVRCARCNRSVEFFKDDATRRCPGCGLRITNPKVRMGCAQWCKFVKECLGFDPNDVEGEDSEEVSLADGFIEAMGKEFGEDRKRVAHALRVLEYAQELLREEGGEARVVIAAAVLHDIGIVEAERKHGSSAGKYQEMEGPPIARRIMEGLGLDEETIEHVCRIVGSHHSAGDIDTVEFRILWDADRLVNMADAFRGDSEATVREKIDRDYRTSAGKKLAHARMVEEQASGGRKAVREG